MDPSSRAMRGLPSLGIAIRRHILAVLVTTIGVAGLAGAYLGSAPTMYTATATIMLSPTPGNPLTPEAASGSTIQFTVAMQTEAEVARTPAIRDLVSEHVGRTVPDEHETLVVESPDNTQMLDISLTSSTPQRAQEGAQGFAEGYLGYRGERATRTQEARIEALEEQLARTDEQLREATAEAVEAGAASYASRQVELLVDRSARLGSSLSAAQAVSTDSGSVINPALLPERSDGIPRSLLLGAAGVFGLILGTMVAMLREWRRDLIGDADEADEVGIPVFATLPRSNAAHLAPVAGEETHEAYRRLRAGVIANGKRPHVLAVAGFDADHASVVSTNLALVLAEAQFSVLLVAADPQGSGVEAILGLENHPGWSDVLRKQRAVAEVLTEVHGFSVLTGGSEPETMREITAGPAFTDLVKSFRYNFDFVILSSAAAGSGDGDAVISAADSVLLVLRSNHTTKGRLLAALERFESLNIVPLGAAKVAESRVARGRRNQRIADPRSASKGRLDRVEVRAHA